MKPLFRLSHLVLAVIALITVAATISLSEVSARLLFAEELGDSCWQTGGKGFKHGCTSRMKVAEGPWVENSYNNCGYRTRESCRPKPPGALRVAVLGTSISKGFGVAYDQSFAARTTKTLTQTCARPVDVQNVNFYFPTGPKDANWQGMGLRTDEALGLSPDAMILMITPFDLINYKPDSPTVPSGPKASAPSIGPADRILSEARSAVARARALREESRAVLMLRHLVYKDPETFLRLYLSDPDSSGYLNTTFSPAWTERMTLLDHTVATVAARAAAGKVPLYLVYTPFEAAPLLIARGDKRPSIDPRRMDHIVSDLARKHGAQYVDLTTALSQTKGLRGLYYSVNGHFNGAGNAVMADVMVKALTAPGQAFASCSSSD